MSTTKTKYKLPHNKVCAKQFIRCATPGSCQNVLANVTVTLVVQILFMKRFNEGNTLIFTLRIPARTARKLV